jgi:hypothetical protein
VNSLGNLHLTCSRRAKVNNPDAPASPRCRRNPLFLKPFMKKLTRQRVLPTISARVCWLTFSTTDFESDCLPERASSKIRASDKKLMQGQPSSRLGWTVIALSTLAMFAAGVAMFVV